MDFASLPKGSKAYCLGKSACRNAGSQHESNCQEGGAPTGHHLAEHIRNVTSWLVELLAMHGMPYKLIASLSFRSRARMIQVDV